MGVRSWRPISFGLAILEAMMRSGAVSMCAPDEAASADQDAATLEAFLGRALRQERAIRSSSALGGLPSQLRRNAA